MAGFRGSVMLSRAYFHFFFYSANKSWVCFLVPVWGWGSGERERERASEQVCPRSIRKSEDASFLEALDTPVLIFSVPFGSYPIPEPVAMPSLVVINTAFPAFSCVGREDVQTKFKDLPRGPLYLPLCCPHVFFTFAPWLLQSFHRYLFSPCGGPALF